MERVATRVLGVLALTLALVACDDPTVPPDTVVIITVDGIATAVRGMNSTDTLVVPLTPTRDGSHNTVRFYEYSVVPTSVQAFDRRRPCSDVLEVAGPRHVPCNPVAP